MLAIMTVDVKQTRARREGGNQAVLDLVGRPPPGQRYVIAKARHVAINVSGPCAAARSRALL